MDITQYLSPELIAQVQTGGYFLMFGLMVIEGPIITIIAAFLASMGLFNIFLVALIGWVGDMVGDLLFFSIGRFGMRIFQKKTTVDTPSEVNFIKKLDTLIHKNLLLSLFIIKFTPYAPPIGITYIGRSQIPFRKYCIASFISCLPIPITTALLGFNIGNISELLQKYTLAEALPYIIWGVLLLIVMVGMLYVLYKKVKNTIGNDFQMMRYKNEKTDTSAEKSAKKGS